MDGNCVEEIDDSFDYLSHLKNGFETKLKRKTNNTILIDINESDGNESDVNESDVNESDVNESDVNESDGNESDGDSNDSLIVNLVRNSSNTQSIDDKNKTKLKTNDLKVVNKSCRNKEVVNSVETKSEVMAKESKVFENKFDINIKSEIKLKLMIDSKESIDKLNANCFDGKSSVKRHNCFDSIDIKPKNVKLETIKKDLKSNEIAVQTKDTKRDIPLSHSQDISDSDKEILTAIGKILSQKQKPNFVRLFSICSKLRHKFSQFSSKAHFLSHLNKAIERGVIRKTYCSDGSIAYSGVEIESSFRRSPSHSSNSDIVNAKESYFELSSNKSSVKRIQPIDDNPITPKKKKPPVEEIEDQSANDPNCTQESESSTNVHNVSIGEDSQGIETGGYCDFEDINVPHSSKIFSDIEVNASDFALKPNHNEDQQISMTYKSLPNPTLNHTKNKEVVRKRMTLVNGYDSDEYENEASLIDYENWLLESLPRYSPFIAQKGDRVLYLRDAHEIYLKNEIQDLKNSYRNFQCTESHINDTLKTDNYIIFAIVSDVKFFQINEIKFSVITLKSSSNETQFEFNVIYRPNRGICEFLVLEQFYKRSQEMNWQINSEFRSLWKKSWWIGVIENRSIFDTKYPQSLFKCFEVKWNTNETGRLSPWDLFVVDPNRLPKNKLNGILTTRKDLMESNYKPSDDEWPPIEGVDSQLWRCHECKRIYKGIKTIEKNISKSFISQFNNIKHKSVAYAVSLQLIKERLKNMYYRRIDSVKCDINYLKSNSKIYLKKSDYESAQNFIELILCIVNDPKCSESEDFLQYIDVYKHLFIETTGNLSHPSFDDHSYSSKAQKSVTKPLHSTPKPSFEAEKKKTTQKKKKINFNVSPDGDTVSSLQSCFKSTEDKRWKEESLKFLDELFRKEETNPFKEPVDVNQYPNYYNVITDPMDLSIIRSNLNKDHYLNPRQLRDDFRLMFDNVKTFTKNPKAPIRIITKNISNLCEDKLREIIVDWERVSNYEQSKMKGKTSRQPIARNHLWGYGAQQYY